MANCLPTTQNGGKMYKEITTGRNEFGTDYLAALKFWGELKENSGNLEKVIEVIKYCEKELGAVTLAYSIKSYVAIWFENSPTRAVVFVNPNFVDHRIEISGSYWYKPRDLWRTDLPTGKRSVSRHKKVPEIKYLLCKICAQQYPANLPRCPICTQGD